MRAMLGILMLTLAACGGESSAPAEPVATAPTADPAPKAAAGDVVARAARAARGVVAAGDAGAAQAALQAEGFTAETYESAMYAIAGDPAQAAAFVAASR